MVSPYAEGSQVKSLTVIGIRRQRATKCGHRKRDSQPAQGRVGQLQSCLSWILVLGRECEGRCATEMMVRLGGGLSGRRREADAGRRREYCRGPCVGLGNEIIPLLCIAAEGAREILKAKARGMRIVGIIGRNREVVGDSSGVIVRGPDSVGDQDSVNERGAHGARGIVGWKTILVNMGQPAGEKADQGEARDEPPAEVSEFEPAL